MTDAINPESAPPLAPKRSRFCRHPILATLLAIPVLAIGACAIMTRDRTVTWEEEVLLNTGETIWVSKEVRYTIKGQPGNPADMGYVPGFEETLSFTYGGRKYA